MVFMQMPQRRSRMRRTWTGKRIELTARDIEIFKLLARYRYLRLPYIQAFVGGASLKRLQDRLCDFFHEGYLDRPEQQWQFAGARYAPAVYESDAGAVRGAARRQGSLWTTRVPFLPLSHIGNMRISLMICEVQASLELGIRADAHLRFIAWPHILARAPEQTRASAMPFRIPLDNGGFLVVPDGLFGIEYISDGKKTYRFFALEVDRGTMPVERSNASQTSYLKKMQAYRDILRHQRHKSHWGIPNLLVLTVTISAPRMREMIDVLEPQAAGSGALLFKAVTANDLTKPLPQLLSEPWQRAGFAPLRIDT